MVTRKSLVLLALLSVGVSAHALPSNGGFELNDWSDYATDPDFYKVYNAGDTGINDWTVGGKSVDLVVAPYAVHSGTFALDLVGTPGPGSIEQLVATGETDQLVKFWAFGTGGINNDLTVTFGNTSQAFTVNAGTWTEYSFVADTDMFQSATIGFYSASNNNSNGNLFLDDISVEAVPEPATMAALGLGLAAIGRKRRS